jgi:biotin carboxylase
LGGGVVVAGGVVADLFELAVRGKKVLVVGGSYIDEFFSHARSLGTELYLVDDPSVADKAVQSLKVARFIPVPEFQRVSIQEPEDVVQQMQAFSRLHGVKFDAVLTLVEDEAPLTSRLAAAFGVAGHSAEASDVARSKTKVRVEMKKAGLPTPEFWLVDNKTHFADLRSTFRSAQYPLFLKPVWGVAAAFASRVDSFDELKQTYDSAQASIDPAAHSIFHFGAQMIIEEMITGVELQLELMLLDGELVFHCFSSSYAEDRSYLVFPPALSQGQKDALLELAHRTARAVGLSTGIVHVEMFWSPRGQTGDIPGTPQIIEINNRLSRGFLPQSFWHQLAFGHTHTDYFASAIYLSLGLRPPVYERARPPLSLAVFLDEPSPNGWETYCECAVFLDDDPFKAVQKGQRVLAERASPRIASTPGPETRQ